MYLVNNIIYSKNVTEKNLRVRGALHEILEGFGPPILCLQLSVPTLVELVRGLLHGFSSKSSSVKLQSTEAKFLRCPSTQNHALRLALMMPRRLRHYTDIIGAEQSFLRIRPSVQYLGSSSYSISPKSACLGHLVVHHVLQRPRVNSQYLTIHGCQATQNLKTPL